LKNVLAGVAACIFADEWYTYSENFIGVCTILFMQNEEAGYETLEGVTFNLSRIFCGCRF